MGLTLKNSLEMSAIIRKEQNDRDKSRTPEQSDRDSSHTEWKNKGKSLFFAFGAIQKTFSSARNSGSIVSSESPGFPVDQCAPFDNRLTEERAVLSDISTESLLLLWSSP
jgi:hypothetical protein